VPRQDKQLCAYLELTRKVDGRRERIQLVLLPPLTPEQLNIFGPRGTSPSDYLPADTFTVWRRRQDFVDHRSRWNRHARIGRAYSKQLAASLVGGFQIAGENRVRRNAPAAWTPSPIVRSAVGTEHVARDILSDKTPYRVINRLKTQATRSYGLDIS